MGLKKNKVYVSHLLTDEEMRFLIQEKNVGIESIEFSISDNLDQLNQTLYSYEKRLEKMGCEDLLLHGPFLDLNPVAFDSIVRNATLQRYEQAYQAARRLGAKKIIYHSCFNPTVYYLEGWAERFIEFFEVFLKNKSDDIEILVENVMDPFPEPLYQIASAIRHPAFGICLDIGHANCFSEISGDVWFEKLKPYIRHVHFHNNYGKKDQHLALENGNTPYKEIVSWMQNHDEITGTIECSTKKDVIDSLTVFAHYSIIST